MELHLKIIGILLIVLGMIHIGFPKYFKWEQDMVPLSLINRQMMYVHTFFIGFVVLLMGILCFTSASELVSTTLGKRVSLGFGIFWTARVFIQFIGYSSKLWKGKNFETFIHILFSFLWIYFSFVFLLIYFKK